jgi:hypothetical protein
MHVFGGWRSQDDANGFAARKIGAIARIIACMPCFGPIIPPLARYFLSAQLD